MLLQGALWVLLALLGVAPTQAQVATSGNIAAVGHHSVLKVKQTDPLPTTGMVPIIAKGAGGEFADFQVFIAPLAAGTSLTGVRIALSDFIGPGGVKLTSNPNANIYSEFYRNVTQKSTAGCGGGPSPYGNTGWFPDELIPVGPDPYYDEPRGPMGTVNSFAVAAGQNQGFWVDLFIPPGTTPGAYNGTVTITDSAGDNLSLPVSLTVWNFTIPATPSVSSYIQGPGVQDFDRGYFGNSWETTSRIAALANLSMKQAIRHRVSFPFIIGNDGWSWNGSAINWNVPGGYGMFSGFDATYGSYLSGSYSGTTDPYLKTGPKMTGKGAFVFGDNWGEGQDCISANRLLNDDLKLTTIFYTPNPIAVSSSPAGSLQTGVWYYIVTSSVAGQGDSGAFNCSAGPYNQPLNELSANIAGTGGSVTLSWPIPTNRKGGTPTAFAVYRSPNPNAGLTPYSYNSARNHGEVLLAVIPAPSGGATTASFTDDGSILANPAAPPVHYYNATAESEAIAVIQAYGQHFTNNTWATPYAYMHDEPNTLYAFDAVAYWSGVFRKAGLGVRPFDTTELPDPWGSAAFGSHRRNLIGKLDTWVPGYTSYSADYWPSAYAQEQSLGRHVWLYDACSASAANIGLQPGSIIDLPALTNRIKYWWIARENDEGYLYYASAQGWNTSPDIWTSNTALAFGNNGDGLIIYPGRPCVGADAGPAGTVCIGGTHGIPIDSLRLKMQRDSEQDLEYLRLLYNPQTHSGDLTAFNQILATVFPAPTLAQPLTASAQTIYLSTAAGMHNPGFTWPDSYVNIEGTEVVAYGGVSSANNALTQCRFTDPANVNSGGCRGYFNSGGSTNNNSVGISHPLNAAVQAPPNNVRGGYFGDPMPLLKAREAIGCALDPVRCALISDTVPPAPFRGLMIK